jgi:uncharacterized protein YutD
VKENTKPIKVARRTEIVNVETNAYQLIENVSKIFGEGSKVDGCVGVFRTVDYFVCILNLYYGVC